MRYKAARLALLAFRPEWREFMRAESVDGQHLMSSRSSTGLALDDELVAGFLVGDSIEIRKAQFYCLYGTKDRLGISG